MFARFPSPSSNLPMHPKNPWLERQRIKNSATIIARKRANESPQRKAAWWTVKDALKSGKLVKEPCQLQHSGCKTKPVQFHHTEGYSSPDLYLVGVWACDNCHDVETRRARAPGPPVGGPGMVIID